jgi:hypothetical protein
MLSELSKAMWTGLKVIFISTTSSANKKLVSDQIKPVIPSSGRPIFEIPTLTG